MGEHTIDTRHGPIEIRTIRADEVAAYRGLRLEALRDHPEAFGHDYEAALAEGPGYWEDRVQKNLGGESAALFVAGAGQELAGMAGIFREQGAKLRHNAFIWGVYVRPAQRGARLADALIGACLEWARARELRTVRLAVNATNGPAIAAYLRCGFSVYGVEAEVIHHNGVYYDELLMACRLTR